MGTKTGPGASPGRILGILGLGIFWINSWTALSSHLFLLLRVPGRRLALRLGRDGQVTKSGQASAQPSATPTSLPGGG